MNFLTRQTLIAKIKNQHDDQSWEEFVFHYKRYIYVVISKMGVGHDNCEDLVQKVVLALWKKLPDFEYMPDKCKFRSWMNKIIKYEVIDFFRKSERHKNDIQRASQQQIADGKEEFDLPDIYKISEVEWKAHISTLAWDNIKGEFTGKTADCFLLFTKGKSVSEICEELQIKKNTAYVFKNRVQERLQQEIRRLDRELS